MQSQVFEDLGLHSTPPGWNPESISGDIVVGYVFKQDPRDFVKECDLYRLIEADYTDKGSVIKKKARLALLKYHPDKAKARFEGEISPDLYNLMNQRLAWVVQATQFSASSSDDQDLLTALGISTTPGQDPTSILAGPDAVLVQ